MQTKWYRNWIVGAFLTVVFQTMIVGYTHQPASQKPSNQLRDRNGRALQCESHLLYTMSDKKGDRYLAVCEKGNCEKGRSYKIKLNNHALFEIGNALRYSHKTIPRTLITTILHLSSRPSGFMLGHGVQARIVLTKDHQTIVGDLFRDQNVKFATGGPIVATGEIWRECNALEQIVSTIHATNQELKKTGPQSLSGAKYLERLESQLTQAKLLADSWQGKIKL